MTDPKHPRPDDRAHPNIPPDSHEDKPSRRTSEPKRRGRKRGSGEGTVQQLSNGRWRGQLMVGRRLDGKPDRRSVYGKTRAEVQAKLDTLRRSAQIGALPPAKSLTFGEFLERWLRDSVRPSVRPKTFESYRHQVRAHIAPALGGHKLVALTPDLIQRYYAAKLDTGLSSTTVKYHHAIIHRTLRQAVRWGLAPRNAAEVVDPPRVRREEMKFLLPEQLGALLTTAIAGGDRLAPLWALAVYSGARQGELLALRWSDVDLEGRALTINRALERVVGGVGIYAEPKTTSSLRTVTLAADAIELLRGHRRRQDEEKRLFGADYADEGLVFCTQQGRPLDRTNVYREFRAALKRAGLPMIRFHDLRHTSATLMLAAGVHLKMAGGRLGHSDIKTTAKYSHLVRGLDMEAAKALDRAIRSGTRASSPRSDAAKHRSRGPSRRGVGQLRLD